MTKLNELKDFAKMWAWLSSHPAHNQDYYMRYVARLDSFWKKSCPLCHTAEGLCKNCELVWKSEDGNLCSDDHSPLNSWRQCSIDDPDHRTYYASRVAMLGLRAKRNLQEITA